MSTRATDISLKGTVVDIQRGGKFKVEINDNQMEVLCTLSGKLRQNNIRVLVGDTVDAAISIDDLTKGRITWRYK
jgi:translation initiation factor IF-1